jgi:hypothetical protein
MKLGLVGSRSFYDLRLVEKVIAKYQEKYGEVIVISGGCPQGADSLAKEAALAMNVPYQEFPPKHRPRNQYCTESEESYNQPYHVRNYFLRNTQIAENCDHLVAFTVKGLPCNGTQDTVKKAQKFGKVVTVLEV